MTEKNDGLTVEKIREQNRKRNRRHYEKNKEAVKQKARERYRRKKLDAKLSEVREEPDLCEQTFLEMGNKKQ